MHVEKTALDGVLRITPPTIFEDFRGKYIETYNKNLYISNGINCEFVQDDISISRRNVLRGIHGDDDTWKLITCLSGSFYLVVVNNDKSSQQYREWASFTLSAENHQQILVPPKFGNGHLVLSESAIFHYKQTTEYNRARQFTIIWNDPLFRIWWPTYSPMLSIRDSGGL